MQKILLISLFLFVASFLKAGDLPKLNLEIGKKYTIETVYLEDTSKTNPGRKYDKRIYEFVPLDFSKTESAYEIRLVVKYYFSVRQDKNIEYEVYETGYSTSSRTPLIYLNMFQVPIKFKITKDNKILSFDFSEYLNIKQPEILKVELRDGDKESIQNDIRDLFFDAGKPQSSKPENTNTRSRFRIINEQESSISVEVDSIKYLPSRLNTPKTNIFFKRFFEKEQYQRKILVAKSTGLILEDKFSFIYNFPLKRSIYRYQKLISSFSEKIEAEQKVAESTYEKTKIQQPNTALRITVQDSTEYSKYIYLTYFDEVTRSIKSFRLQKDKNARFNFQMHLDQNQLVYIHFNPETKNNTKREWINLIPGDDLEIEIYPLTDSGRLIFKGIGAEENRVFQMIRKIIYPSQFGTEYYLFSLYKAQRDSALQILNNYKSVINPELYVDLGNTLFYSQFSSIQNSFADSIIGHRILVCNSLAQSNTVYFNFLTKYIAAFKDNVRHPPTSNNSTFEYYERNYSLGLGLLTEPILTEYLSKVVMDALQLGQWEKAKVFYERHKLDYASNPRFITTKTFYEQQASFSPGKIFPIESITDIYGQALDLKKIKNKLITISLSHLSNPAAIAKEMSDLQDYYKYYSKNSEDLFFVRLVIGEKSRLAPLLASLNLRPNERVIFQNVEDIYLANNPFRPLLNRRTIVVGNKGIILFNRELTYLEIPKAIEDLKKPVILIGKSNFLLKIIVIILLGVLLLTALAFIVYRQISRRKLKQAELSRKMRELELTVIRTRMNPHFMYNCLNSIQNLVQKNQNEEAHLYLSKFASLVRQVLNNSKKDEIALSKELDSVKEYIELEQLRFDFDFRIVLAEGIDMNGIFVPPMLLQPFVENAILHGLLLKKDNRLLEIHILKEQSKITLVVEDNGVGREAAGKSDQKGNGQGILLCRNRLLLLSEKTGIHYELKIEDLTDENQQPTGTRVSIGFVEEE